jgi:hypothetical protein
LLVAKFVPGLTAVMPPLAGVFAVGRVRFRVYDLAGVLLWAGTWLTLGYLFADAITLITARATRLGQMLGLVIVIALVAYVLLKYARRRLFPAAAPQPASTLPASPQAAARRRRTTSRSSTSGTSRSDVAADLRTRFLGSRWLGRPTPSTAGEVRARLPGPRAGPPLLRLIPTRLTSAR